MSAKDQPDISEFLPAPPPRAVDQVLNALDELDPDRAAKLRAALVHPQVTNSKVAKVLRDWGHQVGVTSVARYRHDVLGR